jgi:hypothetical protein
LRVSPIPSQHPLSKYPPKTSVGQCTPK